MRIGIVGTGQMGRTLGEAAADVLRFQIGPMGLAGYATLSVHVLPDTR